MSTTRTITLNIYFLEYHDQIVVLIYWYKIEVVKQNVQKDSKITNKWINCIVILSQFLFLSYRKRHSQDYRKPDKTE